MHAASRAALAEARAGLATAVGTAPGSTRGDAQLALSDELFAVARLLEDQRGLRRAFADQSSSADDRAALAERLLSGKVSAPAVTVVGVVVRQRWSRPLDLIEALETLGVDAALEAADVRRELETVEDELFRFARIIAGDDDLARVLGDANAPREGRVGLLDRLLSGKASPVTEQLVRNALTGAHVHNPANRAIQLSEAAAGRRGQAVAHVTTAIELTSAQESRLTELLGRLYGRTIGLQVQLDPEVLGGLVIRVGDEIIDGSLAARLEAAGRRLAG